MKLPQSSADLVNALDEQLAFLRSSADAFDGGFHAESKRMAVSIRVLVHETKNSKSLLAQLGRLNADFLSTTFPSHPESVMTHGGLIAIAPGVSEYKALLDDVPGAVKQWLPFEKWWQQRIFTDDRKQHLDRKALVLCAADQDGGAHVDPSLDETYARLTRGNSIGWESVSGSARVPMSKAGAAALRQIAHEVLRTLVPGYSKQPPPGSLGGVVIAGVAVVPRVISEAEVEALSGSSVRRGVAPRKTGKNDPCQCGSGRKFKRCHGR